MYFNGKWVERSLKDYDTDIVRCATLHRHWLVELLRAVADMQIRLIAGYNNGSVCVRSLLDPSRPTRPLCNPTANHTCTAHLHRE
jgi:hypothetical protein